MADTDILHGLDDTLRALRALPEELSGKSGGPIKKALLASAKMVRDEVKSRAPVDTGTLRENIVVRRDGHPQNRGAAEHYIIWVRRLRRRYANTKYNRRKGRVGKSYTVAGPAYYAKFLEFGTSKMSARPFFRPAFEASKHEAVKIFAAELAKQVDKAVKKAAKR